MSVRVQTEGRLTFDSFLCDATGNPAGALEDGSTGTEDTSLSSISPKIPFMPPALGCGSVLALPASSVSATREHNK